MDICTMPRVSNIRLLLNDSPPLALGLSLPWDLPHQFEPPILPSRWSEPPVSSSHYTEVSPLSSPTQERGVTITRPQQDATSTPIRGRGRSTSVIIISPTQNSSYSRVLSYKAFSPQQFVKKEELSSPQFKTPSPKLRATKVINLVSPALMTPKLEPAIDLVTPPPKRKRYPKLEPSPLQHGCSIEIISPDSYSDEKPQQNFLVSPHVCEDRRFSSLDEAIQAVYEEEETLGHK